LKLALALAGLALGLAAGCASDSPDGAARSRGPQCDRTASTAAALAQEFDAATSGQTICLTSGSYGTFRAGVKEGVVTVRPRPGATARVALEFAPAVHVRIDGLTVTSATISGRSRNLTIANSRFTGIAAVNAEQMVNAHVVFDGNTHADIDTCTACYAGRLHIEGNSGRPSGVVVANSVFSGGNSDGIRADADGIVIRGNEFFGLRDQDPFHTDPIQIFGGTRTVIRGNYFHDLHVSAAIMMADGGAHNIVEDNVIAPGGYGWALTWYSDDGSVIRHNTFVDGRCGFGLGCGIISLGAKPGEPASHGTVIRDNVLGGISYPGGDPDRMFRARHNLSRDAIPGARNTIGLPTYVGPPGRRSGYRLAPGSLGEHSASDGTDMGIR
jgi:parallel beta helix pectate lyase-like protein